MTQDQFMMAFEWLEENLEMKIYRYDIDDIRMMAEQVVAHER